MAQREKMLAFWRFGADDGVEGVRWPLRAAFPAGQSEPRWANPNSRPEDGGQDGITGLYRTWTRLLTMVNCVFCQEGMGLRMSTWSIMTGDLGVLVDLCLHEECWRAGLNSVELPMQREILLSQGFESGFRVAELNFLVCNSVPVREVWSLVGSSQTPDSLLVFV